MNNQPLTVKDVLAAITEHRAKYGRMPDAISVDAETYDSLLEEVRPMHKYPDKDRVKYFRIGGVKIEKQEEVLW